MKNESVADTEPELQLPSINVDPASVALTMLVVQRFKVKPFFAWYDFWVGAYWDRKERVLYLCPLPMVGLKVMVPRGVGRLMRRSWRGLVAGVLIAIVVGVLMGVLLVSRR